MHSNKCFSLVSAALLVFAGSAHAETRNFEFTGTVTYTSDAAFAAVGTQVHGQFSYDDRDAPVIALDGYASYRPASFVSATVDGHSIFTDRLGVDVWNNYGNYYDMVDISGFPVMLDNELLLDGSFGFRLQTPVGSLKVLKNSNLPAAYDISDFNAAQSYGWLVRDGSQTGTIVQFSVDSIVDECRKKNGKPAKKHCSAQ